jgi:hypothetical protein
MVIFGIVNSTILKTLSLSKGGDAWTKTFKVYSIM